MPQRKMTITFDENGNSQISTEGFVGKNCTKETEKLLKSLADAGLKTDTKKIRYSTEYYKETVTQTVSA